MRYLSLAATIATIALLIAGCGQAAPPATPTKAAEPARPTAAPAAPTKAAEPTKAPAAQPTSAPQPTAAPAKKVDFPAKGQSISFIVPYAPGGSADPSARLLAPLLEKELGVSVQVVNREGASTQIGATELAKARPDGYTIGYVNFPPIVITYLDPERKATYTRKDFAPVAFFFSQPDAMTVRADSPFQGLKDVVDAAKANPGKIKDGTGGLMASPHLSHLALQKLAGIEFSFVHFNGAGPGMTALLGGHVDIAAGSAASAVPQHKSGAARIIGITDRQQAKALPGVKTWAEQGYPLYPASTYGIVAPAGTPREVVDVLTKAIKKATEDAELRSKMEDLTQTVRYLDPDQFAAYWAEAEPQIKELWEEARKTRS